MNETSLVAASVLLAFLLGWPIWAMVLAIGGSLYAAWKGNWK